MRRAIHAAYHAVNQRPDLDRLHQRFNRLPVR